MSSQGFIVAEFSDGVQVIPSLWLQDEEVCKYPAHYKTDARIRKAVEKQEIPSFNWALCRINRIFGEYSSLQKADAKADQAMYTSNMDTEKEGRYYRKYKAKKQKSSSESEEELHNVMLPSPPLPPVKRKYKHCN
ncbi:hypothetical protein X777_01146 [Ooceraea biroi]|uniref:Uncharacterized protein n=1 Tax=Ooceraea biroi TaxID=2015173 RepID=A0A026VSU7_OOCBI|nr:hypothetical protein X777_01146 [Ooceraea biroi]